MLVALGVADPGNLGTLVRSAEAAGAAAILLGPGSVDAYNPKVVRASAGAIFEAVCAIRRRKLPDPTLLGNAGSFFKNPVVTREKRTELISHFPSLVSYALSGGRFKLAAGWLIEACGMKGASRGGAAVYDRQALVLVNRGGASGRDILDLAREVQARVAEKFGVMLEPEAVIV